MKLAITFLALLAFWATASQAIPAAVEKHQCVCGPACACEGACLCSIKAAKAKP